MPFIVQQIAVAVVADDSQLERDLAAAEQKVRRWAGRGFDAPALRLNTAPAETALKGVESLVVRQAKEAGQVAAQLARNQSTLVINSARQVSRLRMVDVRETEQAEREKSRTRQQSAREEVRTAEASSREVIRTRREQYRLEIQEAREAQRQKSQAERQSRPAGNSLLGLGAAYSLQSAGQAATDAITRPLMDAAKASIDYARDTYESLSKSQVVFGQSAAAIERWAQTSARSMGISRQEAVESAATFGNLFRSIGISQAVIPDMSRKVVQLAADLASFNNTSPQEALEALRAGLVGEVEPLRRYGVNLSEMTLKQEAFREGLISTTKVGTLDPLIRTQAAYQLILKQTTTAQGDFSRTASGVANTERILAARIADTEAEIGRGLLPLRKQFLDTELAAVKMAGNAADGFKNLSAVAKTEIGIAAGTLVVGGPLLVGLGSVAQAVIAIRTLYGTVGPAAYAAAAAQVGAAEAAAVGEAAAARGLWTKILPFAKGITIPITLAVIGATAVGEYIKSHLQKDIYDPTNAAAAAEAALPMSSQFTQQRGDLHGDIASLRLMRAQRLALSSHGPMPAGSVSLEEQARLERENNIPRSSLNRPGAGVPQLDAAINKLYHQWETLGRMLPKQSQADKTARYAAPGPDGTPGYVRAMMADAGKNIGMECGVAISHYLGSPGAATRLDTAANRVRPNAAGEYPEGTIFRPGRGRITGQGPYKRGHYEILHYGPNGPVTVESNYVAHDTVSKSRPFDTAREVRESTWGGTVHAYLPPGMARFYPGQGGVSGIPAPAVPQPGQADALARLRQDTRGDLAEATMGQYAYQAYQVRQKAAERLKTPGLTGADRAAIARAEAAELRKIHQDADQAAEKAQAGHLKRIETAQEKNHRQLVAGGMRMIRDMEAQYHQSVAIGRQVDAANALNQKNRDYVEDGSPVQFARERANAKAAYDGTLRNPFVDRKEALAALNKTLAEIEDRAKQATETAALKTPEGRAARTLSDYSSEMQDRTLAARASAGGDDKEAAWRKALAGSRELRDAIIRGGQAARDARAAFDGAFDAERVARTSLALRAYNDEMGHAGAALRLQLGGQSEGAWAKWQAYLSDHADLADKIADDAVAAGAAFARFKGNLDLTRQADQLSAYNAQMGALSQQMQDLQARSGRERFHAANTYVDGDGGVQSRFTRTQEDALWHAQQAVDKATEFRQRMAEVNQGMAGIFDNTFERLASGAHVTFKEIAGDFKGMVIRIIAEAEAAKLASFITGRNGLGGMIGGVFGGRPKDTAPATPVGAATAQKPGVGDFVSAGLSIYSASKGGAAQGAGTPPFAPPPSGGNDWLATAAQVAPLAGPYGQAAAAGLSLIDMFTRKKAAPAPSGAPGQTAGPVPVFIVGMAQGVGAVPGGQNGKGGALGTALGLAGVAGSFLPGGSVIGKVLGGIGKIFHFASGTSSVPGGGGTDTVPAYLTPGEMVLSRPMLTGAMPAPALPAPLLARQGGGVSGGDVGRIVTAALASSGAARPVVVHATQQIGTVSHEADENRLLDGFGRRLEAALATY